MKEVKIFYSPLKIITLLALSILVLLSSTLSIFRTYSITALVLIFFSLIATVYFSFILSIIKKPVIHINNDGIIYSPFGKPKFFIPRKLIAAILLRNTPNKRIIATLDPNNAEIETNLEDYLKYKVEIPSYINIKEQKIPHMYGHGVAMRIELLSVKLNILNKQISDYFAYYLNRK